MFGDLINLGYGIIVFAVIIGVGSIILYNFSGAVGCGGLFPNWNSTSNLCYETGNATNTTATSGTSATNTDYLLTQLGTTGLAGWTPAIIAISVGLLFLGAFMISGGGKGRY